MQKKFLYLLLLCTFLTAVGIGTFYGTSYNYQNKDTIKNPDTTDEFFGSVNGTDKFHGNMTYGTIWNNQTQIEYNKTTPFEPRVYNQSSGNELCSLRTIPGNFSSCNTYPGGLKAFLPLDESGSKAWDHLRGHHGGLNGGITQGATGKIGDAYNFDGTDDYISSLGVTDNLDNGWTVVWWTNHDAPSDGNQQTFYTLFNNNQIWSYHTGSGTTYYSIKDDDGTRHDVTDTTQSKGTWTMHVMTSDGSTYEVYRNNANKLGSASVNGITSVGASDDIGRDGNVGNNYYNGTIDHFKVLNRSVVGNTDIIKAWYNQGTTATSTETDPAASITINEPANDTLINSTVTLDVSFNEDVNASYQLDGGTVQSLCNNCSSGSTSLGDLADGSHNVKVNVTDYDDGSDTAEKTRHFTVNGYNLYREVLDGQDIVEPVNGTAMTDIDENGIPEYIYGVTKDNTLWYDDENTTELETGCTIQTQPVHRRLGGGCGTPLEGFWTFDRQDTEAWDETPNDLNGSVASGVERDKTGKIGGAYKFDNDDHINVSDDSQIDISNTGEIAVSVWVKPAVDLPYASSASQQFYAFASKEDTTNNEGYAFLYDNSTDELKMSVGTGSGFNSVQFSTSLSAGTWYHIVGNWDSSAGTGELWIDGSKQADASLSYGTGNSAKPLVIGAFGSDHTSRTFNGTIDNVKVFNRTLTSSEIKGMSSPNASVDKEVGGGVTVTINDPTSTTYVSDRVWLNGTTSGSANVTYTLNSGSETSLCNECTSFSKLLDVDYGSNSVTVNATNATNSSDFNTDKVSFTVSKSLFTLTQDEWTDRQGSITNATIGNDSLVLDSGESSGEYVTENVRVNDAVDRDKIEVDAAGWTNWVDQGKVMDAANASDPILFVNRSKINDGDSTNYPYRALIWSHADGGNTDLYKSQNMSQGSWELVQDGVYSSTGFNWGRISCDGSTYHVFRTVSDTDTEVWTGSDLTSLSKQHTLSSVTDTGGFVDCDGDFGPAGTWHMYDEQDETADDPSGNALGHLVSDNGIDGWERKSDVIDVSDKAWHTGDVDMVVMNGVENRLFMVMDRTENHPNYRIQLAECSDASTCSLRRQITDDYGGDMTLRWSEENQEFVGLTEYENGKSYPNSDIGMWTSEGPWERLVNTTVEWDTNDDGSFDTSQKTNLSASYGYGSRMDVFDQNISHHFDIGQSYRQKVTFDLFSGSRPIIDNWNLSSGTSTNSAPSITSLTASPDPVDTGNTVNITADITDDGTIDTTQCTLKDADGNIEVNNVSMSETPSDTFFLEHIPAEEPSNLGTWDATCHANDTEGASSSDSTTFQVNSPPKNENLTFTRGTYVGDAIDSVGDASSYSGGSSFQGYSSNRDGYVYMEGESLTHIQYDPEITLQSAQDIISNVSVRSNSVPFDVSMGLVRDNGTQQNLTIDGVSQNSNEPLWMNLSLTQQTGDDYAATLILSTDGGNTIDATTQKTITLPNDTATLRWYSRDVGVDEYRLYEWERQIPATGTYTPGDSVTTRLDATDSDGTISSAELTLTDADNVQQVTNATMTRGAFTTYYYTYDTGNDPADGTWTADATVTDNDSGTDTASGTFTVTPIPDNVILESGVAFTQPDNNAEITIEDQINVSSLAVWTDATEFGGANFSVNGDTSDAIDVNLSYFNRSVQDGYAANFSAATAAGNNVTFAFTNMVVDSFYDVFLDGIFDVERQSDGSGAFQFIETDWDGSYNQYSIQQSNNGRPALTSSLYRLGLARSIERLEFGIDDRDEADIASYAGTGSKHEFTNSSLELDVTLPIDDLYAVTDSAGRSSSNRGIDLAKSNSGLQEDDYGHTLSTQQKNQSITLSNDDTQGVDYNISFQNHGTAQTAESFTGTLPGSSSVTETAVWQDDDLAETVYDAAVEDDSITLDASTDSGFNYTANRPVEVVNSETVQFTGVDTTGQVSTPANCGQINNTEIDVGASATTNYSVRFTCDPGAGGTPSYDVVNISDDTERVWINGTATVNSNLTEETEFIVKIDKDGAKNPSERDGGSLDGYADNNQVNVSVEDGGGFFYLHVGTEHTNSSWHEGSHDYAITYTLSGESTTIISDGGSGGSSDQPDDRGAAFDPSNPYRLAYGTTANDIFVVQNFKNVENQIDLVAQPEESNGCQYISIRQRTEGIVEGQRIKVETEGQFGNSGVIRIPPANEGSLTGSSSEITAPVQIEMPDEATFNAVANENGSLTCRFAAEATRGTVNDLVIEVKPQSNPFMWLFTSVNQFVEALLQTFSTTQQTCFGENNTALLTNETAQCPESAEEVRRMPNRAGAVLILTVLGIGLTVLIYLYR